MHIYKRVFLQEIEASLIATSYSKGCLRRASSIERLLANSLASLDKDFQTNAINLLILSKNDWQKMFSYRYGLATLKTNKNTVSILAPVQYPHQLLHSFDGLLLLVREYGLKPSAELHEYLDLLILLEFIRAVLITNNQKDNLEIQASGLFWQLSSDLDLSELADRIYNWVRIFNSIFEKKLIKCNRNKLAIKNKLALYSFYLSEAK